jgi:hypothetical protein
MPAARLPHAAIHFGSLTVAQQLAMLKKTTVFIAREGADFANMIFLPPFSALIEFWVGELDSYWHQPPARLLGHVMVSVMLKRTADGTHHASYSKLEQVSIQSRS